MERCDVQCSPKASPGMGLLAHYGHLGMLKEGAALTIKDIHH
jgi:hypothetical protein